MTVNGQEVAVVGDRSMAALPVAQVRGQIQQIQELMRDCMQKDQHYGTVPGTQKPTLLKAGAEKLCLMFRLDPQYDIVESVKKDDFISYVVRCTLHHMGSGQRIASGMGACNSREAKYRYRWTPSENKPSQDEAAKMKAQGLGKWKKIDNSWVWHTRAENDNPHDQDNTLLKMACKRAHVAAVLNGTAASDIFTQDLEDMSEPEAETAASTTTKAPSGDEGRVIGKKAEDTPAAEGAVLTLSCFVRKVTKPGKTTGPNPKRFPGQIETTDGHFLKSWDEAVIATAEHALKGKSTLWVEYKKSQYGLEVVKASTPAQMEKVETAETAEDIQ
jgi:hypothetical protein